MISATTIYGVNVILILLLLGIAFAMVGTASREKSDGRWSGRKGFLFASWFSLNRFIAVFLILLGIKLYWIHHYVSNVPFWDQWDAEGHNLYVNFLRGDLDWGLFFQAHNEHRIFWTRFWALGQFLLNSQWDIQWQTVANAFLHSFSGALFLEVLVRHFRGRGQLFWITLIIVIFAGPYGCANLLFGFQSQFYFLQFFGAGALILVFGARPLGVSWYLGWICLLFAYFSMAGGVIISGVVFVGSLIRLLLRDPESPWVLDLGWVFSAAIFCALGFWGIPEVPHHQEMKADGIFHLVSNFIHLAAWPFVSPKFSLDQALGLAVILWAPWLIVVLTGFFNKAFRFKLGKGYWLILCLGGWVLATAFASSYSRGNSISFGYSDRYADLFGMGALVAFIAIATLVFSDFSGAFKRMLFTVGTSSAIAWVVGLSFFNHHALEESLPFYGEIGVNHIENINDFVQTGNPDILSKEPEKELPLDKPESLRRYLSDPVYRSILPWTVREPIGLKLKADAAGSPSFLPDGVPPEARGRPGETVWGSFHPEAGNAYQAQSRFGLERPSELPFLVVYLAGYPRAEGIELVAEGPGTGPQNLWRTKPGNRWLDRRFSAGQGEPRLNVLDTSESTWVAFSEPRELGWYSFAAILVAKRYDLFLGAGLVLLAIIYISYPIGFRVHHPLRHWRRFYRALQAFNAAWREEGRKTGGDPPSRDQSS